MKEMQCPVIILLSGTPGTGKTSIARILEELYDWKIFALGDFILDRRLYISTDEINNTKIIDTEKASIEGVKEILKIGFNYSSAINIEHNLEAKEKVIVIESHYSDIIVDGFQSYYHSTKDLELNSDFNLQNLIISCISKYCRGDNLLAFVMRCDPAILEKRLTERGYSTNKVLENVQAEILNEGTVNMVEVVNKDMIFEVDTSKYTGNETAQIIHKVFLNPVFGKEKFSFGNINWMLKLIRDDTLNNYFKKDLGIKRELDLNRNVD